MPKPKTKDALAAESAAEIRRDFWNRYEAELAPDRCAKRTYYDELCQLEADLLGRIEAVRDELREEGEEV